MNIKGVPQTQDISQDMTWYNSGPCFLNTLHVYQYTSIHTIFDSIFANPVKYCVYT